MTRPIISLAGTAVGYATENYLGMSASIADAVKGALPQIAYIGAVGSISAYAFNNPKIDCVFIG
jgi:hypothetical protein